MTESAAFANEARKDCFKDLDVEKYVIVETLDGKTCSLCAQLDGKVYPMSEYDLHGAFFMPKRRQRSDNQHLRCQLGDHRKKRSR